MNSQTLAWVELIEGFEPFERRVRLASVETLYKINPEIEPAVLAGESKDRGIVAKVLCFWYISFVVVADLEHGGLVLTGYCNLRAREKAPALKLISERVSP